MLLQKLSTVFTLGALFAVGFAAPVLAQDTLTAIKVAKPPKLQAGAGDAAWKKAKPLAVSLAGGQNFKGGSTRVVMKAVYSGDMFYLLVQYDDPTQSVRRSPFVKQADGSWRKLSDPDDKGGDNNKYYEDKFAII